MYRFVIIAVLILVGLLACAVPAHAADPAPTSVPTPMATAAPFNWNEYDTAAYVVSTLNVVRTGDRRLLVPLMTAQYGVTRFAVWDDLQTDGYVIQLKRASGVNVAQLVYKLGWDQAGSYSRLTDRLGVPRPPQAIEGHFRTHAKRLIGTFNATLPL
jgi:hypothetical protein